MISNIVNVVLVQLMVGMNIQELGGDPEYISRVYEDGREEKINLKNNK